MLCAPTVCSVQLQGRAARGLGSSGEGDADVVADGAATVVSGSQTPVAASSTWQDVPLSDGVDVLGSFLKCSRSSRPSIDEADELRTTLLQMSPLARRLTRRSDIFRALLSKGLEKVAKSAAMTAVMDLLCAGEVRLPVVSVVACTALVCDLRRCGHRARALRATVALRGYACRARRPSL
jgi:hypothetical protein